MARHGGDTSALPHQLTSFVGRASDLRAVKDALASARLVTLVGTGGAGKSRLALEVARAGEKRWPDGLWRAELASTSDVAAALLATLELPGRGEAREVIAAWLGPRRALLILDNCEHVIDQCADLARRLLERCEQLSILATSREPLGVPGEVRRPVTSLDTADAIRLFEVRGRLVAPAFTVTDSNLETVTGICARLDRLPLAIEMAAVRLDVMSERELLRNLESGLRLLRAETRGVPERQQTMIAAIEWSYQLLGAEEARLFRRLAVFRGGFTLEAANAIGVDLQPSVLELLSALVRKSMVVAERLDDGSTRYRLLETHLAFAADRLADSGELEEARRLHHDFFLGWLDAAPRRRRTAGEAENLWAALDWAGKDSPDRGLEFAVRLAEIEFSDQGRIREVLLGLLPDAADSETKARAMNLAARLVARHGENTRSESLAGASVKLARAIGDRELLAYVIRGAGLVHHTRGDLKTAAAMYAEALSLLEGSADQALAIEAKNALGVVAVEQGEHAKALALLEECVDYSRGHEDHTSLARYLESLANARLAAGEAEAAASAWIEALPIFRALNDAFGALWCLGGLALAAAHRGDAERALRLAAAADRVGREWSLTTGPYRRQQLEEMLRRSRSALSPQRADAARREGEAMAMGQAIDYALRAAAAVAPAAADAGPLTKREREVAAMVAEGLTNRQIAERLFISERTAEGHVERIRDKLGVRSRTEVATWAVSRGLAAPKLDKSNRPSTV